MRLTEKTMLTALIFVISTVMLAQFAVCYWRAGIRKIAAQPVSPGIIEAGASIGLSSVGTDFSEISAIAEICPDAGAAVSRFFMLRSYCFLMEAIASMCSRLNSISAGQMQTWARQEVDTCTRYLAVQMEIRFRTNQALLAEIRSY